MNKYILAKKLGMSQFINDEGKVVPVTVLAACDSLVLKHKTLETNGYTAVVVGYEAVEDKHLNKPMKGFFDKLSATPKKFVKEIRTANVENYSLNEALKLEVFSAGDIVTVSGRSIGKGFAGTIKRHNFNRGPMSHGSKSHRIPGSIGAGTTPGRVVPGKKMAGRMGNERVTIKNLTVVSVDLEKGLVFLKGAVPGKANALVEIYS
ncbi:MAG: 50S ribosomal protein L3 [Candidatus Margulisiibacteriota bacterium]